MRILTIISFLFTGISLFGQSGGNCSKSTATFDTTSNESYRSIIYAKNTLTINFIGEGEQIDSVLHIISGSDTLDRLDNKHLKDFEEILPYLGIPDWKLILRINEMTPYDQREKEYRNLARTYKQMSPHFFGNFSEGYAVVKTPLGYNFIDRTGQLLFDCHFENATNFMDGWATVKLNGNWMSINPEGTTTPLKN